MSIASPERTYSEKVHALLSEPDFGLKLGLSEFQERLKSSDYRGRVYSLLKSDAGLTIDQKEFDSRLLTEYHEAKDAGVKDTRINPLDIDEIVKRWIKVKPIGPLEKGVKLSDYDPGKRTEKQEQADLQNKNMIEEFRAAYQFLDDEQRNVVKQKIEQIEDEEVKKGFRSAILLTGKYDPDAPERGTLEQIQESAFGQRHVSRFSAIAAELAPLIPGVAGFVDYLKEPELEIDKLPWYERLAENMSNATGLRLEARDAQDINEMIKGERSTAKTIGQSLPMAIEIGLMTMLTRGRGKPTQVQLPRFVENVTRTQAAFNFLSKTGEKALSFSLKAGAHAGKQGVAFEAANVAFRGGKDKDVSFEQGVYEGLGEAVGVKLFGMKYTDQLMAHGLPKRVAARIWQMFGGGGAEFIGEAAGDIGTGQLSIEDIKKDPGILGDYLAVSMIFSGASVGGQVAAKSVWGKAVDDLVQSGEISEAWAEPAKEAFDKIAPKQILEEVNSTVQAEEVSQVAQEERVQETQTKKDAEVLTEGQSTESPSRQGEAGTVMEGEENVEFKGFEQFKVREETERGLETVPDYRRGLERVIQYLGEGGQYSAQARKGLQEGTKSYIEGFFKQRKIAFDDQGQISNIAYRLGENIAQSKNVDAARSLVDYLTSLEADPKAEGGFRQLASEAIEALFSYQTNKGTEFETESQKEFFEERSRIRDIENTVERNRALRELIDKHIAKIWGEQYVNPQDITGLPGGEQEGQTVVQTKSVEGAGQEAIGTGGVVQTAQEIIPETGKQKYSKFAEKVINDPTIDIAVRQIVLDDDYGTFRQEKLDDVIAAAKKDIESYKDVNELVRNIALNPKNLPERVILAESMMLARHFENEKDYEASADLWDQMTIKSKDMGRNLNAYKLLQRISPRTTLAFHQKQLAKMRLEFLDKNTVAINEILTNPDTKKAVSKIKKIKNKSELLKKVLDLRDKGELGKESLEKLILDHTDIPKITQEVVDEINVLVDKVEKSKGSRSRLEAETNLDSYLRRHLGVTKKELVTSFWYASILSGPSTHAINFSSTNMSYLTDFAIEAMRQSVTNPAMFGDFLNTMKRGYEQGLLEAKSTLKTGVSTFRGKIDQNALDLVSPKDFTTRLGKGVGASAVIMRYVGRLMRAEDAAVVYAAKEMEAFVLAQEMARKEGLRGSGLRRRVSEILGDSERFEQAMEQAKDEGLSGLEQKRRAYEIIDESRPEDIVEGSKEFALEVTFNNKPKGTIGRFATMIDNLIRAGLSSEREIEVAAGAVVRSQIPFTGVVANVLSRGLDFTPFGAVRAVSMYRAAENTRLANREMMRATLGTLAMAGVYALAKAYADDEDPFFDVTGKGTGNFSKDFQLRESGWKPYSIKIGKTYIPYQYSPFAFPFAIIGNLRDSEKYRKFDEKELRDRVGYAVANGLKVITDMSFVSNVVGIMNALSSENPGSVSSRLSSQVARTATSIIPNFVKQADRFFDPTVYDAKTIEGKIIRDLPAIRTLLNKKFNALGEEVNYQTPSPNLKDIQEWVQVEPQKDNKHWEFIAKRKFFIPVRGRSEALDGKPMTDSQYDIYALSYAKRMKQLLVSGALDQNGNVVGGLKRLEKMKDDQLNTEKKKMSELALDYARSRARSVK